MPRLFALSDLHLNHAENREAIERMPAHPADWLVLAGDLGEKRAHLEWLFERLVPRWAQLVWVPGNHELWTPPSEGEQGLRGEGRYLDQVALCRQYGVLTPEDSYVPWPEDPGLFICPLFLLYDYSFAPPDVDAVAWAREAGIVAMDERLLHPDPHGSREDWCHARVAETAARLSRVPGRTVLINHWPLREDLVRLCRIPRYAPWCGTTLTHDWHTRFRADVVISGHLHMRATDYRDGVRFEEVSLGYPRHWQRETDAIGYLRQILPGPTPIGVDDHGPVWHR